MSPELLRNEFLQAQSVLSTEETFELIQLKTLQDIARAITQHQNVAETSRHPILPPELPPAELQSRRNAVFAQGCQAEQFSTALTDLYSAYRSIWIRNASENAKTRGPSPS